MERDKSMASAFGMVYGMDRGMSFLPELRDFLKENGIIYTVRKYKMVDAQVEVEGVGRCHRIPLGKIDGKEDLVKFVEFSGFPTVNDWWKKVRYFIPDSNSPMYLYKVLVSVLGVET